MKFEKLLEEFPTIFRNSSVTIKLRTSHRYIPFSKKFLPSITLDACSALNKICVDIKSDNLRGSNQWDIKGTSRILYSKQFERLYGCSLQLIKSEEKVHSNLLVWSDNSSWTWGPPTLKTLLEKSLVVLSTE